MDNTDLELQLKVWKDLAISKQVLMQAATKALGLSAECSAQELDEALKKTIAATKVAEDKLAEFQEQTKVEKSDLDAKINRQEKEIAKLTEEKDSAIAELKSMEDGRQASKAAASEEVKKLKSQLSEKQKEIKQITKVLADTPENVVKKMKALKKDKMDEANTRKKAEELNRTLKKDKQKVDQELEEANAVIEKAAELAEKYKALDTFANEQYNQLADKVDDKDALENVPALDNDLLEVIENATSSEEDEKKK